MCGGPERLKPSSDPSPAPSATSTTMTNLTVETEDAFSSLLELAANNDLDGFKLLVERDSSAIDEIGLWYGRNKGSNQMVLQHRTPLMVAATYGSIDVLNLIVSLSAADVNRHASDDDTTALHCAASGGSANAVDAVKLLLLAGADPSSLDANDDRPADVIVVSPKLPDVKLALEELLGTGDHHRNLRISTNSSDSTSPPLSASVSADEDSSPSSDSTSSPVTSKFLDSFPLPAALEKYPADPSLPDIRNSIYSTDEFRMFSFKVRPCSRAYSHDWTECPFVHPGENARRRDPRKYHYSCVPCPDFRKGACRRGDLCEYAHGVFECWLHPAQYRTRLCKDGPGCSRRVCFFAHTAEELRPLFVSTGSAVPSPRSSAAALGMSLLPGSPSSMSVISPSPFTPPMSPSAANGMGGHGSMPWPQPNVPTLILPTTNLQSSRLRTSLNARDVLVDELSVLQELEAQRQEQQQQQLLSDYSTFSSRINGSGRSKAMTPANLDDLFCAEISSSPRFNIDHPSVAAFSPSHKSALLSQFQQQQSILSPINTNAPQQSHSSLLQSSFGISSSGRLSPRSIDPVSPMSTRLAALSQREKQLQFQQMRSLSSRELGSGTSAMVGSPVMSSLSKWGSPSGKLEWAVNGEELGRLRRSNSFELGANSANGEEPDLSWVQSLVKDSSPEITGPMNAAAAVAFAGGEKPGGLGELLDQTVLGVWMEQMQLDQKMATS